MQYKKGMEFILGALAIMLALQALATITPLPIRHFGIYPRNPDTLLFILTAPFVHGNWPHLANNAIGLGIFGLLCLWRGYRTLVFLSVVIIVLGGLFTWCVGRPAVHIGASGWVFGLWASALAYGWFDRRFWSIVIAMVVIFFYGGMVVGVLPTENMISFESHLGGAIAGVLGVWLATTRPIKRKLRGR